MKKTDDKYISEVRESAVGAYAGKFPSLAQGGTTIRDNLDKSIVYDEWVNSQIDDMDEHLTRGIVKLVTLEQMQKEISKILQNVREQEAEARAN